MSLDLTAFDAALKVNYSDSRLTVATYQDRPFLALVPKKENFVGKNMPFPIRYANPGGRSATFATAKTNMVEGKYTDFVLTRNHDYGLVSIDNETLEASKGDAASFIDAVTGEIDGMLDALRDSLAHSIFGDGSGAIGQVNAEPDTGASSFVITLKNTNDIVAVEVGQVHNIYSALTGGSKRNSDGTDDEWVVAAVDRDAGTITYTGEYSGSGTIAANDYIFIEGDRGAKLKGLAAWLPYTAPSTSEDFFGVDRSVDPVRLAGVRMDLSSVSQEEAAIKLMTRLHREGANPSHYFLNPANYQNLVLELGAKVQYQKVAAKVGDAEIGFEGIKLAGPRGAITVLSDKSCSSSYGYMLDLKEWKLCSLGKAPKLLMSDGLRMLRESDSDGVQIRAGYYAQLGCHRPGSSGVAKLV
jgi:hypothetical protein